MYANKSVSELTTHPVGTLLTKEKNQAEEFLPAIEKYGSRRAPE